MGYRKQTEFCDLHVAKYAPVAGSSYIKLPAIIARKKAVINIKNQDMKCFIWSVLAGLYPHKRNAEKVTKYSAHEKSVDSTGLKMPMELNAIPEFEVKNNLRINVYGYTDEGLEVLYISERKMGTCINLLLLLEDEKSHYCLIKNLDRLLSTQRVHHGKKFFCHRCLLPMYSSERLSEHSQYCAASGKRILMPKEDHCEFRNVHKMQRRPFIMYADFECLTEKIPMCKPNSNVSYTVKYQKHTPSSFGILGITDCGHNHKELQPYEAYRGPDPVTKFLETVIAKSIEHQQRLQQHIKYATRPDPATTCSICNKPSNQSIWW